MCRHLWFTAIYACTMWSSFYNFIPLVFIICRDLHVIREMEVFTTANMQVTFDYNWLDVGISVRLIWSRYSSHEPRRLIRSFDRKLCHRRSRISRSIILLESFPPEWISTTTFAIPIEIRNSPFEFKFRALDLNFPLL